MASKDGFCPFGFLPKYSNNKRIKQNYSFDVRTGTFLSDFDSTKICFQHGFCKFFSDFTTDYELRIKCVRQIFENTYLERHKLPTLTKNLFFNRVSFGSNAGDENPHCSHWFNFLQWVHVEAMSVVTIMSQVLILV